MEGIGLICRQKKRETVLSEFMRDYKDSKMTTKW